MNIEKVFINLKFLAPILMVFLVVTFEGTRLFFSGMPDPYLYLGYAINYSGLQYYWGHTYFASRLWVILPLSVREALNIDLEIWRTLLLGVCALVLFRIFHKTFGYLKALIASVIVINIPWNFRHFGDDYVYSYATLFSLISLSVLIPESIKSDQKINRKLFVSGFFFFCAISSHQSYLVSISPALGVLMLHLLKSKSARQKRELLFYFIIGVSTGLLLLLALQFRLSGITGLKNNLIVFRAAANLTGEKGLIWTYPLSISTTIILLAYSTCLIFLIPQTFEWLRTKILISNSSEAQKFPNDLILLSLGVLCSISVGILWHFYVSGAVLSSTTYSYIFAPPILILCTRVLAAAKTKLLISLLCFTMLLHFTLNAGLASRLVVSLSQNSMIRVALIAASFMIAIQLFRKKVRVTATVISLTIFLNLYINPLLYDDKSFFISRSSEVSSGEYRKFFLQSQLFLERDTQYLARKFAKLMKDEIGGSSYYWTLYPSSPSFLMALDSTQLWGYSCYKCANLRGYPVERPYPPSKSDVVELKKRDLIVLFDNNRSRLNAAIKTTQSLDSDFVIRDYFELHSQSQSIFVAIVYTGRAAVES